MPVAARDTLGTDDAQESGLARRSLPHRGLAVSIGLSVTSDAEGMVPTGGELTVIEAVGRGRA